MTKKKAVDKEIYSSVRISGETKKALAIIGGKLQQNNERFVSANYVVWHLIEKSYPTIATKVLQRGKKEDKK